MLDFLGIRPIKDCGGITIVPCKTKHVTADFAEFPSPHDFYQDREEDVPHID